ncbi:MAG: hypothetical protein ACON39_05660 [Coraliomargaritaceae bacterium]
MRSPTTPVPFSVLLVIGTIAALLFSGCEKNEPTSYSIPKEERNYAKPTAPAQTSGETSAQPSTETTSGGMRMLPGMQAAADAAPDLSYTLPTGWQDLGAKGMRKANLQISGAFGTIEVTALTFPGDVGGLAANINRWAGQVGLEAYPEADIDSIATPQYISNHKGRFVKLAGPEQSIIAGILPFHGSTWFFKMKGPSDATLAQEDNFKTFLDSIQIEDTHH